MVFHGFQIHLGVYSYDLYFICMCVIVCYSSKMSIYLNVIYQNVNFLQLIWECNASPQEVNVGFSLPIF